LYAHMNNKRKKKKTSCYSQRRWLTLATWEAEIGRMEFWGQPGQIVHETSIFKKITRTKWAGGVAHTVEHLLCKCEIMCSNPSPTRKKEKQIPHVVYFIFFLSLTLEPHSTSCIF
jgi:hypothetical protein